MLPTSRNAVCGVYFVYFVYLFLYSAPNSQVTQIPQPERERLKNPRPLHS